MAETIRRAANNGQNVSYSQSSSANYGIFFSYSQSGEFTANMFLIRTAALRIKSVIPTLQFTATIGLICRAALQIKTNCNFFRRAALRITASCGRTHYSSLHRRTFKPIGYTSLKGVSDVSAYNGFGPWAEPSNGVTGEVFSLAWAEPSVYATSASGLRGPKQLTNCNC